MVAEDGIGVMGYALAALDFKQLQQKKMMAWVPSMQEKYGRPQTEDKLTTEQVARTLHSMDHFVNCQMQKSVKTYQPLNNLQAV